MAEQTVLVELQVSSEQAVKNIEDAKGKLNGYREDIKKLKDTDDDYIQKLTDLKTKMIEQNNVIKANTDALKQNVRESKSNKDSLVAMRAELKKATTAFDNLSKAERNGAQGQELQHHIRVLTDEISNAEQSTGRFQRNVGNYKNSMVEAFTAVGGAAGGKMANGIKTATGAMKVMAANPLIAVLSLLISVITKVVSSLKTNEEAFNRVKVAMSAFRGVGVIVQNIVDKLASGIAWLAEKVGNFLAKITQAKDELKEEQAITKEEIALKKQQRQLEVELARNENKISELRLKATQTSKYSAAERKQMMKEAQQLETQNYNLQVQVASKELELIRRRNAQAASGEKDIDAEYAAEKKLLDLRTEHNNALAALSKKEESYGNQMKNTKVVVKETIEIVEEEMQDLDEELHKFEAEVDQLWAYQQSSAQGDAAVQKYFDDYAKFREAVKAYDEEQKASLEDQKNAAYEVYTDETASFQDRLAAYKEYVAKTKEIAKSETEIQKAKTTAIVELSSNISEAMEALAGDNKEMVLASKVIALAEVAIKQGVAIAEAIASSAEGDPYTYAIRVASAIASTVGAMATAIRSINSAKLATGGYVEGAGTGTSDSIPAMLSNGESVINAKSTAKYYDLLSAINQDGGGVAFGGRTTKSKFATGGYIDTSALSGSFRTSQLESLLDSVSKIQPVVSVREITKAQNKVSLKEQIARS